MNWIIAEMKQSHRTTALVAGGPESYDRSFIRKAINAFRNITINTGRGLRTSALSTLL